MGNKSTCNPVAVSIYELFKKFPDEESARKYLEEKRWKGTPTCPHCGSQHTIIWRKDIQGYYHCQECREKFCVKTGTIFKNTKIPLHKWLHAFYFIITARKGISSMELSKKLGITQKSAWLLGHKIRQAMKNKEHFLNGMVEMDEPYIGGKEKNKHSKKKLRVRGTNGKITVFGIVERGGELCMQVVADKRRETLRSIIEQKVKPGSTLNTDDGKWYTRIEEPEYERVMVNHSARQYVDETAYTNTIESAWAVLKRGIYGVFHKVSTKHLQRYLNEFMFRWNEGNCKYLTMSRIDNLIVGCWNEVLPYKVLVRG